MSLPVVRVRAASMADVAGVIVLERAVVEAPHWAEADYREILAADETGGGVRRCLFVAEAEGALRGFAVGKVIGGELERLAELESVVVCVETRRAGVGRGLCAAVVEWCRMGGATVVELEVRSASAGAIALYEGLGFVRVGRRRAYYHEPMDDALLMEMKLA